MKAEGGDLADLNGTVTLSFASSHDIKDTANNALDTTQTPSPNDTTFDVDNTAPTVTSIVRQDPAASPTNANSLTWRVTFSEDVANVDNADFTVTGTMAAVTGVTVVTAPTVYDVTVSGGDLATLDATVTLSFAGGQDIADASGNALDTTGTPSPNDVTFDVDNTKPTVTITDVPDESDGPFTAVFTFSEAVNDFTVDDIAVVNGTAAAFTATDAMTWTARIAPDADGAVTVNVAADVATDAAGNGNTAATQASSTYTAPTLSLTVSSDAMAEAGGASTLTVSTGAATFATDQTIDLALGGTASQTSDYTISSTSLTLTAGTTSVTATVMAVDDNYDDDGETVIITASYGIGTIGSETVTITDNDDAPTFSFMVSDASPSEAGEETATLTVSLAGSSVFEYPQTITLQLSGTATEGEG